MPMMNIGGTMVNLTDKEYKDIQKNLKSPEELALYKAYTSNRQGKNTKKEAAKTTNADWKNPEYVKGMIVQIGREQGLTDKEIEFALAIAAKESGFNVNAHNRGTAKNPEDSYGVFQINKDAHPDYTAGLDPIGNITYGVNFAAQKYRQAKGNARLAARMYNGSGRMAEQYADDFTKNYMPKYSKDYSEGKIAQIDPSQPIANVPTDITAQNETERIRTNYEQALTEARKNYNFANAKQVLDYYNQQYNAVLNNLRQSYPMATQEQIAAASQKYLDQIGLTRDFVQKQVDTIKELSSPEAVVDPRIKAYNEQSLALQQQLNAANPYTQLAQNAPIQMEPIDIEGLKATQASDRFGAALGAMTDPTAPRPDYAALKLQQASQLEQAARYNQAVENSRVAGLPIDYFLAGRGMDYNTLASLGQDRLANKQALYNAYLSNVVPNLNRDIATMTNTANTSAAQAMQEARLAEKQLADYNTERMKQEFALADKGLAGSNTLLNTALQGANAQDLANTTVVPSIYSTSEAATTSRLNQIDQAQAALEAARLKQQQDQATQNMTPVYTGMVNAGYSTNNPTLMNAGAAGYMTQAGYSPEQIQNILGSGQGGIRPQTNIGMIMPNAVYGGAMGVNGVNNNAQY